MLQDSRHGGARRKAKPLRHLFPIAHCRMSFDVGRLSGDDCRAAPRNDRHFGLHCAHGRIREPSGIVAFASFGLTALDRALLSWRN